MSAKPAWAALASTTLAFAAYGGTMEDMKAVAALDTGFASQSHFTARFRAFFRMTPEALRRSASAAELRKIVTAQPPAAA